MKTKNKAIVGMLLGILLILIELFGTKGNFYELPKMVSGLLIGFGFGLLGASFATLINEWLIRHNADMRKQVEIEKTDERVIAINEKAKAKSFETYNYAFALLLVIGIILDINFWYLLLLAGFHVLMTLIYLYYVGKYQKEM